MCGLGCHSACRAGCGYAIGVPILACAGRGAGMPWEPHCQHAMVACGARGCKLRELEGRGRVIINSPTAGVCPGAGPAAAEFVSLHIRWWVASQNRMSLEDSPWGGVWSGSFPSRSIPFPPISQCILELDLGRTGPTRGLPQRQVRF